MSSRAVISAIDEDAWEGRALVDNTITERGDRIILNNNLAPVSVAGIDDIQQEGEVRQVINRGTQPVTFAAEDEAADGKDRFATPITISPGESVYIFYNGLRWEPFTARNVTVEGEAGGSDVIQFAVGDRLTPIVAADNVMSWPVPRSAPLTEVQAYLTSPATTGTFTVRIKQNGTSILSTNITIDAGEQNSVTAIVPAALSTSSLTKGSELTVDIVDAADGTASGLIITLIGGAPEPEPEPEPPPDTEPEITTLSLPNGTEGVAYNQTVAVTGGNAPLVFTVSAGALPTGLTLNAATGAITGTPTVVDTFNFTIRVTDDDGDFDDQAYSVEVVEPEVINVALAANGSTASASSSVSGAEPSQAIDGTRWAEFHGWSSVGTGTPLGSPEWLVVDFGQSRTISRIDLLNYSAVEPVLDTTTMGAGGARDFKLQYWNGAAWVDIVDITSNDKVWRQFTFSAQATTQIRLYVTSANGGGDVRVAELEAWGY